MVNEYKQNLIKRIFTSFIVMMPIVFVIYYQNLIFFSLLICVVCLGAFYEWIKNNLDNKVLGLFVILNFGICSIIFIVMQVLLICLRTLGSCRSRVGLRICMHVIHTLNHSFLCFLIGFIRSYAKNRLVSSRSKCLDSSSLPLYSLPLSAVLS